MNTKSFVSFSRKRCVALVLFSTFLSSAAAGQTPGVRQEQPGPWTVTVYLGASSRGPATDLEAAMIANGWDERGGVGCGFFGCSSGSPSPTSNSFANPLLLGIRYQLRSLYAAEFMFGQALSGYTSGHRDDEDLNIDHAGIIVSPLLSVGNRHVRASVGPALLRTKWMYWEAALDREQDEQTTIALGWVGGVGVGIPLLSRFVLEFQGQYRGFGSSDLKSYRGARHTFPAISASSEHRYFAAGLGARF